MNCRMTRGIYLRANGEINCYCSTGEQISLAHLPIDSLDYDFVIDYYLKNKFAHIRDSIANNKLPFPEHCLKCNYLDPYGHFSPEKVDTEIEWFHIEAAAVCNLRCPFCVHGIPHHERKYGRTPPHFLPLELYKKILDDINTAGLSIKWIYFSGRGEPGIHPEIWRMVEYCKQRFITNFLVNTNGNIDYDDLIVDSGLDKIKIAFDSHYQEVYSRYRVKGNVDDIFELTRRIAKRKEQTLSTTPEIIWQRVMFNFNDSEQELLEYQQKAKDYGVNLLRIVYTWTQNFSCKRIDSFPKIFPNIQFLDGYSRVNMPIEELRTKLQETSRSRTIPDYVFLLSRILHWFELGTIDRDGYDDFANLSISDERLFYLRQDDPHLSEYKAVFRKCLCELSRLYKQKGEFHTSSLYFSFATKIHS